VVGVPARSVGARRRGQLTVDRRAVAHDPVPHEGVVSALRRRSNGPRAGRRWAWIAR
jgi:hypothetical protein